MTDPQPVVSDATCHAAASLASTAAGMVGVKEGVTESQRAEAARLLRTAADMLAPVVPAVPPKTCRCIRRSRSRDGDSATVTINQQQPPGSGSGFAAHEALHAQQLAATRRAMGA